VLLEKFEGGGRFPEALSGASPILWIAIGVMLESLSSVSLSNVFCGCAPLDLEDLARVSEARK
jgi:hypothetical protein